MVIINGKEENVDGITVSKYLSDLEYNKARVAVEVNGDILPKSLYEETILKAGDIVEVVSFVGGG